MKSGVPYSFDLSEEKRHILVVEDEPVNQGILKMMIGDTYEVLSEYNGQEAMELILARILRTIELSENRDILRWTERDCTIKNSSIITPHSWTSIIKHLRRRHFPEYQPFSHHQ